MAARPVHPSTHTDTNLHSIWQFLFAASSASFTCFITFFTSSCWKLICPPVSSRVWISFSSDSSLFFCSRFLNKEITAEPTQPSTHNVTNSQSIWQFAWAAVFASFICWIIFLTSLCFMCFDVFAMIWFMVLCLYLVCSDAFASCLCFFWSFCFFWVSSSFISPSSMPWVSSSSKESEAIFVDSSFPTSSFSETITMSKQAWLQKLKCGQNFRQVELILLAWCFDSVAIWPFIALNSFSFCIRFSNTSSRITMAYKGEACSRVNVTINLQIHIYPQKKS